MLLFNDISVYLTKVIQWLRQITGYKAMGFAMSMSHNQYRVWPPLAWLTAAHFCRIDITRSSVVSCRMFSHSSWRAICNWLMFTGSRCQRRTAWSRTSQTCSILGQIRGICRPMKHKEILVIQKLCPCGRRVGWHCRAKKWYSGNRKAGQSGAVSQPGIWQHSDYQQWHAVVCEVQTAQTNVHLRHRVPPFIRQWCQHFAPMCDVTRDAAHLFCEAGNMTRHWREHSSIVLASSRWTSWPKGVAVVVEQVECNPCRGRRAQGSHPRSRFWTVWGHIRSLNRPTVSYAMVETAMRPLQIWSIWI